MYYRWNSHTDFTMWHDTVCVALGIPHPNSNGATGEIDYDAQWTTAYTEAVQVATDDWRAYVEDEISAQFPSGLGTPSEPPPSISFPDEL